jgi:hypothetical protein
MKSVWRFLTRPKYTWQAGLIFFGLVFICGAAADRLGRSGSVRFTFGVFVAAWIVDWLAKQGEKDAEKERTQKP